MTTDPSKVWADRTKMAVTTPVGTRIMRPSYGCSLPLQLFANTEDSYITLDSDLSNTFTRWLPDLKYEGTNVVASPDTGEAFINVNYTTPAAVETDQITVVVEY